MKAYHAAASVMLLVFSGVAALGCTCAPRNLARNMREAAAQQKEGSSVIFEGFVERQALAEGPIDLPPNMLSNTSQQSHRVVTIAVSRLYQGTVDKRVTLLTGIGNGDCGFDFRTGESYLVYAETSGDDQLRTSICSGTTPLEQAGPALRVLRNLPPAPDDLLDPNSYFAKHTPDWTGQLCGKITQPNGDPLSNAVLEFAEVHEWGFGAIGSPDVVSDQAGAFCLVNISPGKYLLSAEKVDYDNNSRWVGSYPSAQSYSNAAPVEVKAGGSQTGLNIRVHRQKLYTVRIKIRAPDANPIPWERLSIALDSSDPRPFGYHAVHSINEDGSYTLYLVAAGRYIARSTMSPGGEPSNWKMAQTQVEIKSDTEIVLNLFRAH